MHQLKLITILPFLLLSACLLSAKNDGGNQANKKEEKQKIQWLTFEEAVKKSNQRPLKERKKIFIDIYTDWCGWCKKMDRTTFQDPEVIEFMNKHFYPVKLDAEMKRNIILNDDTLEHINRGRRGTHELALKLMNGRASYPTIVFLDERFNMIAPMPGFKRAKTLEPILKFFGENHHQEDKDINKYIKQYNNGEKNQEKAKEKETSNNKNSQKEQ